MRRPESDSMLIGRRAALRMAGAVGTAAALGSLAGCVGANKVDQSVSKLGPRPRELSGTVTVLTQASQIASKEFVEFRRIFSQKHPKVTLKFVSVPGDTWAAEFDTVQVRITAGVGYDVMYVPTEGQRLLASRGLIEPLDPYMHRDAALMKPLLESVPPRLLDLVDKYGSPDGNRYYLPYVYNTVGVHVNTEMFKQAGVPIPDGSWTWDEFYSAAKKLTSPGSTNGFAVENSEFLLAPWFFTNGARIYSDDWKTAELATPAAIESMTFLRQLIAEGISPAITPTGAQSATRFANNQLAMYVSGRWGKIELEPLHAIGKTRIVPMPHKVRDANVVGTGAWAIFSSSKNKEAAWALLQESLSPEVQRMWARYGTEIPASTDAVNSSDYASGSPAGSQVLQRNLDYAISTGGQTKGNQIQDEIARAFPQMLNGQVDVTKGMTALNTKMQALL